VPDTIIGTMCPSAQVIIEKLKSREIALRAAGLSGLYLFGSTARNEARPDSDVDLFLTMEPGKDLNLSDHLQLRDDLSVAIGTKVDLVILANIEDPTIRAHALAEAIPIFGPDLPRPPGVVGRGKSLLPYLRRIIKNADLLLDLVGRNGREPGAWHDHIYHAALHMIERIALALARLPSAMRERRPALQSIGFDESTLHYPNDPDRQVIAEFLARRLMPMREAAAAALAEEEAREALPSESSQGAP